MELSKATLSICETHYDTKCGECPIREECVEHIGPGKEALTRWTKQLNMAAEKKAGR